MVCLGNICRSPLAEGILKSLVSKKELDWYIDSAGTGGWHAGELPDPRSRAIALENGIDISNQRARKLLASDLDEFDLILAMDASNYNDILALANDEFSESKVKMILNYANPGMNEQVPDPYYGGNQGFQDVYKLLEKACRAIIEEHCDDSTL